ncbi:MAG: Ig-like domain-containing protein [Verrucomicrobia bacterium]|nr:Ig-like domain-containing protein [Verrucomicrobiota bacterium]
MKKVFVPASAFLFLVAAQPADSAVYKEAGGRVVVEAEHFDARTSNTTDNHHWAIIPDENGKPDAAADPGFSNARGGKYMQTLPDSAGGGQNNNSVAGVNADPHLDFKVQIGNPGRYRLWLRWGGYDGSSDSMYAQILEVKAMGGLGPDWYRYIGNNNGDLASVAWNGSGAPSTDAANNVGGGGGEVPAVWTIAAPGTYTIRLTMREDGGAVDALILQLDSMAPPTQPGPAESETTTGPDTTAPTLTDAQTYGNPSGVAVIFSEAVSPATATNKNNYSVDNGVTVSSAAMGNNNFTVILTTSAIAPGRLFQVTVNGVQDTAATPNTIKANSTFQFLQTDGVIERRAFLGIESANLTAFMAAPTFAANKPDVVDYPSIFEGPVNWANNYGTQFRGYVTAPATGNYTFFLCSDDQSELYLSTDENPANKRLIASETAWSNSRQWQNSGGSSDLAQKRSDQALGPIVLTAGKRYYIEAIQREGGGGDNIAVAWQTPGAPEPADGDSPIPGRYLSAFGATAKAVTIDTQPASQNVFEPGPATFSVVGAGFPPPTDYQWFRNGTPILGATGPSYTLPLTKLSDSGSKFTVQVANGYSRVASSEATLTVTSDTIPPEPTAVGSTISQSKIITVTFNELMDKSSAEVAQNYVFSPGDIKATAASLDASLKTVTVTAGSALSPNVTTTLSMSGVKDYAGNTVAKGAAVKFIVTPVTYQDNILFDKPLGFYRFEETSGAVAKNSGTTGGDGAYYTGDEATPGEGGAPSSPKGTAGPRPPAFAGFDASNRSASFDGAGEWVDTKNRYLNGLRAFSLEYWVLTTDRVNQGNRIGIVGQNDAIEYGYINPTTIQIWTPGGGNLNTTVSFPDNEWHHIATIADGTNLKTYYDGALVGTGGTATSNYGTSTYNVHIGGAGVFDVTGNWFNGNIDEVAIFDKAIPAERIAAHYAAGKQGGLLVKMIDTTPPRPVQVASVNAAYNVVTLSFSEPMDKVSTETAKNYVFTPGNIAASSAVLDAAGTTVTIRTSAALTPSVENTLTLSGLKDQADNTIVAGTNIKFTFTPVTYEANILLDKPLGYYRFEEASGAVAKNSGTTGGDGAYFTGDEASARAGGTPSTAKGAAGPRPPAFVGFDAGNRAASFDGAGEWVDTKNQFLNGLGAFSLEYWVLTNDRANQGNRIGIVGQNDAIEYGFINPTTIQIWTPGGGSLNTTYTFPDNEWHHVATIAEGTSLKTYYDGALVGSGGTATKNYGVSAYNVHIGGAGVFDVTGNWFNGRIDEVAIFDKAIPAERIAAHYKAGTDGGVLLTSGAVTVPGTGGGGTIALNVARSGNTLTISWSPSGGTLQTTTALGGTATVWTDVGTANPATVTLGTGSGFYRVKGP